MFPLSRHAFVLMLACCVAPALPPWVEGAHAQARTSSCGRAGRPWVSLAFVGDAWSPALRESVIADLRAGLRLRGIEVCALGNSGSEPPLALLQLGAASEHRVSVTIDVHDAITEKRVLRDVDLREITSDARGLRIAQGAEELLRASWAELALEDARVPALRPPVEVMQAVAPAARARETSAELGARFAMEHHLAGQTWLGGEGFLAYFWTPRVGAELSFGARHGVPTRVSNGRIEASVLTSALDLCLSLSPPEARYGVTAKLGARLFNLTLRGRPSGDDDSGTDSALGVSARATVAVRMALTDALRVSLDAGPGWSLRSVRAADGGHTQTGTQGLSLHAMLGLGVGF